MTRSWKHRRRIIYATLIFSAAGVAYLILRGEDTRLHETLGSGLLMLSGSVVGSYVFGAAWDDLNASRSSRKEGDA